MGLGKGGEGGATGKRESWNKNLCLFYVSEYLVPTVLLAFIYFL